MECQSLLFELWIGGCSRFEQEKDSSNDQVYAVMDDKVAEAPSQSYHSRRRKRRPRRSVSPTDAILPITDPYIMQIVNREKKFAFRKHHLAATVERIWFYRTAPHSCMEYICEIDPGISSQQARNEVLPEDELGNDELNDRDEQWQSSDWAYKIRSTFRIDPPIALSTMREMYGFRSAPRGLMYLPSSMRTAMSWSQQTRIF